MTITQTAPPTRPRQFPSGVTLVAAFELVTIALLLSLSKSPAFYAAAIACGLCSIQLCVLLIERFRINTLNIRKIARQAEFSTNLIFITDPEGRIKWTNSTFTRVTGYNLADVAGKTFSMILHGQDTDTRQVEKIRKSLRQHQPFQVDVVQYDRRGKKLYVNAWGQPITDARGEVKHYVVTQIDNSDQHRQAAKAREIAELKSSPKETVFLGDGVELVRKLADLSAEDDRAHLEKLINNLKAEVEKCVTGLPALTTQVKASLPNDRAA